MITTLVMQRISVFCKRGHMKEKNLTPDVVASLNGSPIRLSSPYTDGKLLTVSPDGDVTSEPLGEGFDQYWRLIPAHESYSHSTAGVRTAVGGKDDKGFLLASSKNGDMICHRMTDGGSIISKPLSYNTKDCVWNIGNDGEIYQPNPEGGERYLWLANDKLYATLDGFLAENWVPLSDIEQPKIDESVVLPDSESSESISLIIFMIIAIVLVIVMYKK